MVRRSYPVVLVIPFCLPGVPLHIQRCPEHPVAHIQVQKWFLPILNALCALDRLSGTLPLNHSGTTQGPVAQQKNKYLKNRWNLSWELSFDTAICQYVFCYYFVSGVSLKTEFPTMIKRMSKQIWNVIFSESKQQRKQNIQKNSMKTHIL